MNNINKTLINKRFKKSINTYNENAVVQKQMAEKLISLLNNYKSSYFNTVFEIGCGTGFLTSLISENLKFNKLIINDLISEFEPIIKKELSNSNLKFIGGDIENFNFYSGNNFDLVMSNASLQWLTDFEKFVENIASVITEDGIFAFSAFGEKNLNELKTVTNIGLEYLSIKKYKDILSKYFTIEHVEEVFVKLHFETSIDIIKHLKNTGVNAVSENCWTKNDFVKLDKEFTKHFTDDEGFYITFNPSYFICRKK